MGGLLLPDDLTYLSALLTHTWERVDPASSGTVLASEAGASWVRMVPVVNRCSVCGLAFSPARAVYFRRPMTCQETLVHEILGS